MIYDPHNFMIFNRFQLIKGNVYKSVFLAFSMYVRSINVLILMCVYYSLNLIILTSGIGNYLLKERKDYISSR